MTPPDPAPPRLPLHVADYLGDTRHLTTEQHGAYLLLLMALWRAGGRLPHDPDRLARVCGLTPGRWRQAAAAIMPFLRIEHGQVGHDGLAAELERAGRVSGQRRRAGARGGAEAARRRRAETGEAARA